MNPYLGKLKNVILDILFPPLCLNCQKILSPSKLGSNPLNQFICSDCTSTIKLNSTLFCPICRSRLADNRKICHKKSPYLLASASDYEEPVIRNLIHYFKYRSFENIAPILGALLITYLKNILENSKLKIENFIVVPIPLHPRRQRERGFNQAELLALPIARYFNLDFVDCLKRIKDTKPQVKIKNNEKRTDNVTNCFKLKNPTLISGKNIILVDDVFTSGATMNEAVETIKSAGAKRIIALTVAKT